ncbi:MAG: hypothetical protein NZ555_11485 [Geminicoccaceae bacterium]|nr:hypothetical protein [Geminicoccaceae bacterium]MCX8101762.1 hypothetical protein [Geminicoccaceae bacterium]MDW8370662.1 hypothetical protein [Geminicoccaceae bacterium]
MTDPAERVPANRRLLAIVPDRAWWSSPFVPTAVLALGLAGVLAADLAERVPATLATRGGTPSPVAVDEGATASGAALPVNGAPNPAGALGDLLPVPAVEPAAGPTAPAGAATSTGAGDRGAPRDPLADVAAELARKAETLRQREHELALRETAALAVEARATEQVARLEALKKELEKLLQEIRGRDEAEIAQLVKTYEAMKAKSAAQVFDQLPLDLLLPIVRKMREAKLAAILAAMEPGRAKQLTAALARPADLPRVP